MSKGFFDGLLSFDFRWSNRSLLAAKHILPLAHPFHAQKLAKYRLFAAISCAVELLGLFLLLYGALLNDKVLFAVGVSLKVASHLYVGVLQNRSGVFLNLFFQRQLNVLNRYLREFSGLLNQKGLTDSEIKGISFLPNDLYLAELSNTSYSHYLYIFTPLVCATALMTQGHITMSILIATLGLLSMPLGQWFYKQFSFRQQREQRFAETAQQYAYMDRLYKKHIALTFLVNMTSQLPLAIFTIMMVMGVYSSNFANYLALTMGLSGLIGVLGFQKMRVTAQNTVSKAVHLLHALSGSEFLITSHQWQEHIKNKNTSFKDTNIENGILLQEFSPTAFFHTKFKALNVSIPTGGVYLFQAPSGSGKSTLILALLHLVQHSGDFYVIRNFKQVNIHTFERDQIDNSIVFVRLEDLSASARLMDIFADVLRLRLNKLDVQIKSRFGDVLTDLAFKGSDNLLEQEIGHLKNNEKSIFPSEMYSLLSQLHQQKTSLLQSILNNGCGENVTPDRIWCTLSDGEKRRVINVLTIEKALVSPEAVLVIFDEPLVHLDEENIKRQLDEISRLQSLKKVSLMIISHLHIEALVNTLDNVQTESFLLNKIPYINVSNLVMDHPSRQIAP